MYYQSKDSKELSSLMGLIKEDMRSNERVCLNCSYHWSGVGQRWHK